MTNKVLKMKIGMDSVVVKNIGELKKAISELDDSIAIESRVLAEEGANLVACDLFGKPYILMDYNHND